MEINEISLIRRRKLHLWPFINSGIRTRDAALLTESFNRHLELNLGVASPRDIILKEGIAGGVQTIAANIILKEDVAA
ncbi:hypothetical protein RchiOBHm_Chr1g0315301 [Rosa chinensis]|uniref:Uncharacterized protein n=1 Tax=Rosa chinensis TaxID=74649 RepID=A0A2P6S7B1_ROSCH|nr:hypothetical protein RchiOBHm_Chr1g0315301 [Rosa chinensis]